MTRKELVDDLPERKGITRAAASCTRRIPPLDFDHGDQSAERRIPSSESGSQGFEPGGKYNLPARTGVGMSYGFIQREAEIHPRHWSTNTQTSRKTMSTTRKFSRFTCGALQVRWRDSFRRVWDFFFASVIPLGPMPDGRDLVNIIRSFYHALKMNASSEPTGHKLLTIGSTRIKVLPQTTIV